MTDVLNVTEKDSLSECMRYADLYANGSEINKQTHRDVLETKINALFKEIDRLEYELTLRKRDLSKTVFEVSE